MLPSTRWLLLIFGLTALPACALSHPEDPARLGSPDDFTRDFNAASGRVRVVAVVSPT